LSFDVSKILKYHQFISAWFLGLLGVLLAKMPAKVHAIVHKILLIRVPISYIHTLDGEKHNYV